MAIDILTFGIVKEIAGSSVITLPAGGSITVAELKAGIEIQYPRIAQLASYMIAVNGTYAKAATIINAGDEVAIIPPVSGG